VAGAAAFADPATLSEFVNFVRTKGEELKARAVVSIVPKAKVAFPQVGLCTAVVLSLAERVAGAWRGHQSVSCRTPHLPHALTQTWAASALWPYAREQDGVFVQLQALCPPGAAPAVAAPAKPAKGGVKAPKQQQDAGKPADQEQASGASVQLAKLWFVRLGERTEGGGFKTRTAHELPHDLSLLPSLLR
jgi:hypothetical protein